MRRFWDELWKREGEFMLSAKREFRHGASFVGVSTLASQYYCEFKVENEFRLGEIPTEAKDVGAEFHDELMPMAKMTAKEFADLVTKESPSYAVLNVWGTAGGLRLVGTPDHIVWSGGRPLWLLELKTTKGDPNPLWDDQENQVRIYGLLLDKMGFDCSGLRLALVRLRAGELGEEERREWVFKVSTALMENGTRTLEEKYRGLMKVHLLEHDVGRAEKAVLAEAGYWLGEREPTSSTSVGKCRACEYSQVCPKSLFKTT